MDNENKEHIGAPSSRDYVPLTKKNRQELRSRIVDAFTRLDRRSALANRGEENPFVRMFNPRLSVAILLLSLGFTLIFLVFLGLPYLSRKFEEVQRTTFLNGPQQLLTDVQKHLNSDDFASLRTQTGSLETSFNGLRKSLEDLNSFTRALHESSSSGTLASQTLSVETEKLKQATNDFHSAIVSLGGLSGTPAAPTTPPVAAAPTLLDQVTKLNEQVASMVEPQELEDLRKKIVSDVPGIEGEASKKLSNVITYWRESESYYNDGQWRKFTKEDYVALDKLTLPAASNQNLENTKLFLDKIANIPALHRVEPQTKALLVTFNERVHAVSDSENAIAESSKRVEMAEVALNSAITSLKDNTVLTKMDEQSNAIYATVATAADTMQ